MGCIGTDERIIGPEKESLGSYRIKRKAQCLFTESCGVVIETPRIFAWQFVNITSAIRKKPLTVIQTGERHQECAPGMGHDVRKIGVTFKDAGIDKPSGDERGVED
jgi:hypothetical protein